MKFLGIDPGEKYFGLALGEKEINIAFPYKVLEFDKIENLVKNLKEILEKEKIQKIIIGRPLNFSGEETLQTKNIDKIVEKIEENIKIPMIRFDERLTSKMAEVATKIPAYRPAGRPAYRTGRRKIYKSAKK